MPDEITPLKQIAEHYTRNARAENTLRAYRADWQHFTRWCRTHKVQPLPASVDTLRLYLAEIAGYYKMSTISRRVAAISVAHQLKNLPNPTHSMEVREQLRGIRKSISVPTEHKAVVRSETILRLSGWKPTSLIDVRDKAILLTCYAGAYKRSELVEIQVDDLAEAPEGLAIRIVKPRKNGPFWKPVSFSKNRDVCPATAIKAWIAASGIDSGPLFRPIDRHGNIGSAALSPQSISVILKRMAPHFGLDPEDVASHSLRAGMVTDLLAAGAAKSDVIRLSGLSDGRMLQSYADQANLFAVNYVELAGLK